MHPITDLQIEYSLISRGIETTSFQPCRELGIAITAYGILSRGLISGHWSKERSEQGRDFRSHSPRFAGNNLDHNLSPCGCPADNRRFQRCDCCPIAIAWVLSRGDTILPLIGARRRDRLAEALGALDVELTKGILLRSSGQFPRMRPRASAINAQGMASLDSERNARGGRMIEAVLTRERILDAAEDVLRRHGPTKANVIDWQGALGVSHGSVYPPFFRARRFCAMRSPNAGSPRFLTARGDRC